MVHTFGVFTVGSGGFAQQQPYIHWEGCGVGVDFALVYDGKVEWIVGGYVYAGVEVIDVVVGVAHIVEAAHCDVVVILMVALNLEVVVWVGSHVDGELGVVVQALMGDVVPA